ncbi:lactonase family protein [Chitinophaga japonensis]|uniref:6-phosphogluconolactonase n=1 Tax=Chitinophaga japonensis TaxID=104662 RepID=A0A562TDY2_CHIJA|nr:lactonase family protein [Chitinophaga japonensis]TWI91729.1 6-phosphogluconolactonase [Chitinophaga japonensis]
MPKLFLTVCAWLLPGLLLAQDTTAGQEADQYLLVGTYTKKTSEGIYVYTFNTQTGAVKHVSTATGVDNPSYLAIAPDQQHVYSVNETGTERTGGVSAFLLDHASGQLQLLNKQPAGGEGPCYINTDQDGRHVLVGNYASGSLSVLPVQADGKVGPPLQTIQHTGSSVNKNRQEKPHVHCVEFSPDYRFLYVPDLGIDKVGIYQYTPEPPLMLQEANPSYVGLPPGSGPRHITFHPNGKWAYLIHELDGKVSAYRYDTGRLTPVQTVSTLPAGFKGVISGADIHVSPDGKFLYASNRGSLNNIVYYAIHPNSGKLQRKGQQSTGGKTPRNFMIDPSGHFLLAANQDTDNIVVFKRNTVTGALKPTGEEIKVSMPVCLKMVPVQQ